MEQALPQRSGPREHQWLYREQLGNGDQQPTAIFLSWDYSSVIFTATCDPERNELVLRYYLQPEWSVTNGASLELASGGQVVSLTTTQEEARRVLQARTKVTPQLRALLTTDDEIEIAAPNEMGEPWYVGYAEPLKKVALSCG